MSLRLAMNFRHSRFHVRARKGAVVVEVAGHAVVVAAEASVGLKVK